MAHAKRWYSGMRYMDQGPSSTKKRKPLVPWDGKVWGQLLNHEGGPGYICIQVHIIHRYAYYIYISIFFVFCLFGPTVLFSIALCRALAYRPVGVLLACCLKAEGWYLHFVSQTRHEALGLEAPIMQAYFT